ncbi:Ser/Thr protein phosphatase [Histomonas meleagridis]|uniref:Ser/Thr protein phosphatase n=1 Tax=Histomonas meleagridis TaxID=135588 RepID=UPI00355AC68F|nr:Ser/Thr protein phosphatase [Histomonas meleagridis]KAH0805526.1 Ser/Thr protein phosphatase [Histomonas meleagridis]
MQSPFYIVMNYIQRDLFTDGTRELVLILSSGPTNEKCYAHLVGIWATIQVFCGAFILLDPKDGWARTDDDQNLYKNSISCVINDECEGPVIFPHLLIKVSSIGSYRSCPRAVYFREISTFKDPTFNSLYGRIATTLIQRYIHSHCNGEEITASSISDELVRDNLVSTYQIDKLDIPKEIASHSIKTVNDMYMQISKLSEYIDEPHSVLMTIPRFDSLFRTSKAFPGYGCTNSFLNTSIWSFHNGIHGCLSCIVEINDNENIHYVPVEVISTVGGTLQTDLKNGHVLSLTAQTQLIGERYGKEHSSYAFIWYLGSKQRFWVRPRKEERQHLRILRNLIATSIVKNEAPFVQSMNTSECSYCVSQVTSKQNFLMEDFDPTPIIESIRQGERVSEKDVETLLLKLMEVLYTESNVLELSSPIIICGDIHGQLYDVFELFKTAGDGDETIGDKKFLFMGDYIDRGRYSIETFSYLAALKLKYPQQFYLLRGNHECRAVNQLYGFYSECVHCYGHAGLWSLCNDVFDLLPMAALIDGEVFSVHGGLSPKITLIESISLKNRKAELPCSGPLCDLCWSDPDDIQSWHENQRGAGYFFGAPQVKEFCYNNGIKFITRSHQLAMEGYQEFFDRQLVTVWSAPNYMYRSGNKASILKYNKGDTTLDYKIFDACPPEKRKIPDDPPASTYFL